MCGTKGTVKPKWKRAESRIKRVARRQVGMHRERRLDIGEGGDDDAPDALDGIERQDAFVPLDQPPHHLGLARRAEGGAAVFCAALDRDQPVDDLAALDQAAGASPRR